MKLSFTIQPQRFKVIHELPNAWTDEDYKKLLDIMDYGDISDLNSKELKEMCLLSLSDNEPVDAANLILTYLFEEQLNSGQIDNLSNEIIEEKLWEEYADLSLHEALFNATQLLYEAYNGKFPHPEAVLINFDIIPGDTKNKKSLTTDIEANLIRLLADAMPENTLLKRLFENQLKGEDFPDAKDIIWQYKKESKDGDKYQLEIISSTYWFHDFKYVEDYQTELTHIEA
ncbi:hypothetical protein Celal_2802 [Cellulophaga algicola DSM 14237]|uniref:Uncharacterized protein n=1 Tax=Cellulophaga algicola (strain DSM 14237 / IC166 / ACAM 630) TaxID=688270 RepID=E6XCU2_CELAD|nr:hypothetical protein [Cellulophaga algicola]ADV50083.1 hypothetical protein Celal_2802 [Cellulophaga algicola DSM 14237]